MHQFEFPELLMQHNSSPAPVMPGSQISKLHQCATGLKGGARMSVTSISFSLSSSISPTTALRIAQESQQTI